MSQYRRFVWFRNIHRFPLNIRLGRFIENDRIANALLTSAKVRAASDAAYNAPGRESRSVEISCACSDLNAHFLPQLKNRPLDPPFRGNSEYPEFASLYEANLMPSEASLSSETLATPHRK